MHMQRKQMHNTNMRVVLYDMLQMLEEATSQTGEVNKMMHKIDKFIKKGKYLLYIYYLCKSFLKLNICHVFADSEYLFVLSL